MTSLAVVIMKIKVTHDVQPENEIFINADCLCDFCQTKYPEWMMHSVGDVQVCEACYDHYND